MTLRACWWRRHLLTSNELVRLCFVRLQPRVRPRLDPNHVLHAEQREEVDRHLPRALKGPAWILDVVAC